MSKSNEALFIALLHCRHEGWFVPAPRYGDKVYCRRCRDYSVVERLTPQWSWRCPTSCHTARYYGADREEALRGARSHVTRTGHEVQLKRAGKVEEVVGPEQTSLLGLYNANQIHQKKLRDVGRKTTLQDE